jgi:hypothetical protein
MSASPTYRYDVVFPSSFTHSYVVNIETDVVRTFTVTDKTPTGFRIESNSITPFSEVVYWEANDLSTGEFGAIVGLQGPAGLGGGTSGGGYQGLQGFAGVTGSDGPQGLTGETGFTGVQGIQGLAGTQGYEGLTGLQGYQGAQGWQGQQGHQGLTGLQGYQGYQGWQGPTGPGFDSISSPATGRLLTATGSSTTNAVAQRNLTYDGNLLTLTASNFQMTDGQSWITLKSNGSTTASVAVDFNNGNIQSYTLNANTSFTLSNGKSGGTYILLITQGASSLTASFAPCKWSNGIPPVVSTTNGAVDIFTFIFDGSIYYGSAVQNFV